MMSQVASQSKSRANGAAGASVILSAQGVKKSYRMGDETISILRHIDLTLREGEFVAIEGRSGSGKSTLLHILGGLDAPDAGRLEFNGRDYTAHFAGEKESRRRRVTLAGLILLMAALEVANYFLFHGIVFALCAIAIIVVIAVAFF